MCRRQCQRVEVQLRRDGAEQLEEFLTAPHGKKKKSVSKNKFMTQGPAWVIRNSASVGESQSSKQLHLISAHLFNHFTTVYPDLSRFCMIAFGMHNRRRWELSICFDLEFLNWLTQETRIIQCSPGVAESGTCQVVGVDTLTTAGGAPATRQRTSEAIWGDFTVMK